MSDREEKPIDWLRHRYYATQPSTIANELIKQEPSVLDYVKSIHMEQLNLMLSKGEPKRRLVSVSILDKNAGEDDPLYKEVCRWAVEYWFDVRCPAEVFVEQDFDSACTVVYGRMRCVAVPKRLASKKRLEFIKNLKLKQNYESVLSLAALGSTT